MRKTFGRQRHLDCPSVTSVSLNLNCRNETIPILRTLQHIYSTPKPVFYSLFLYLFSLQGVTSTPMRLGTMRRSA